MPFVNTTNGVALYLNHLFLFKSKDIAQTAIFIRIYWIQKQIKRVLL